MTAMVGRLRSAGKFDCINKTGGDDDNRPRHAGLERCTVHCFVRPLYFGAFHVLGYPESPPVLPRWAERAKRAHVNMAENLAPFAALVLVAHLTQSANSTTALGAAIFFWARLVHAIVFIAGVPWVRTLAFTVSIIGELLILSQLL
jgi:hypothetical protein